MINNSTLLIHNSSIDMWMNIFIISMTVLLTVLLLLYSKSVNNNNAESIRFITESNYSQ